jgi:hypothetical protein
MGGIIRAFAIAILFCCAILSVSAPASAQNHLVDRSTGTVEKASPAPVPSQSALPAAAVSEVTQAAVRGGVLTCASRIDQVMKYLSGDTQSGAFLFFPQRQPDQSVFSASLEVPVQNSGTVYASAGFAANALGGCGAMYDTVEYSASSCGDVERIVLKGLKRSGVIKKDIVVLLAGSVRVFLMPAGSGCVIIKKEVVQ